MMVEGLAYRETVNRPPGLDGSVNGRGNAVFDRFPG
jgi:hypothetical protein